MSVCHVPGSELGVGIPVVKEMTVISAFRGLPFWWGWTGTMGMGGQNNHKPPYGLWNKKGEG